MGGDRCADLNGLSVAKERRFEKNGAPRRSNAKANLRSTPAPDAFGPCSAASASNSNSRKPRSVCEPIPCVRSFNFQRSPAIFRSSNDHTRKHHASARRRSEEHTSELQSLMRISYAVFCLKKKTQ